MDNDARKDTKVAKNSKLLVNFETQKVISIQEEWGSAKCQALLKKGYKYVADIKQDGRIFIGPEYFNSQDKYLTGNIDTIET